MPVPSTDAWEGVMLSPKRDFHTFHTTADDEHIAAVQALHGGDPAPPAMEVLIDMRAVVGVVQEPAGCVLVVGGTAISVIEPYRDVLNILANGDGAAL